MTSVIRPGDFLKQAVGMKIRVRLNNGIDFRGNLKCLDGFLNIAMENTEEFEGDILKKTYGDAFVRGNNVVYITVESNMK